MCPAGSPLPTPDGPGVPTGTDLADIGASETRLRRFLRELPAVDPDDVDRQVTLASEPLPEHRRREDVDLAIRLLDLTTLEATDTPERVRALAERARRPDPDDPGCPPVAAVCVYADRVVDVVPVLAGTDVRVAAVAGAFPSGRAKLAVKLLEARGAVEDGADEIDLVMDRAAFLAGDVGRVHDEIAAIRHAVDRAGAVDDRVVHLKVILETGGLGTLDDVLRASWLALLAGADTIKTSTGKLTPAATPEATAVMLHAVRDHQGITGEHRGVKVAGGIRTTGQALRYLVLAREVAGEQWLRPDRLRIGASSLLDDLLRERRRTVA